MTSALVMSVCGCGKPVLEARTAPPAEPGEISTPTSIITPDTSFSAPQLLARAQQHLDNGRYEEATKDFRLVSEQAAHPEERLQALLGWGTALDLGGEPAAALRVYSRYTSEAPAGPDRSRAEVRVVRILVYLERYEEARELAQRVSLEERAALERIALHAAMALGALERDDLGAAKSQIGQGRLVVDRHGFDRASVPPLDVAALYFALGELLRRKGEAIGFDPLPADFSQTLEERCQLVLDAQAAYSEVMRSQDAHWSSMAGVRVGHLYQHLHRDLVKMPSPVAARSDEQRKLFEGAIRLRYSILLRKALSMMEATVALLQRSEQRSAWGKRAQESLREIEEARQEEEAAIDALPYSRAQLQQVLDDMAARATGASPQMSERESRTLKNK